MHLSTEIVFDLIEGRLVKDEETFWQEHLGVCSGCTQDIDRWRRLRADLKRSHLKSASGEILNTVMKFFPHRRVENEPHPPSVVAALVFDAFRDLALANARGAVAGRQLVMRAEDFDFHIKIWGQPDRRQMLGQLLPLGISKFVGTARFHLLQNGERLETTTNDETGEFYFTDVPDGDLALQIDLPNLTVVGALNISKSSES